MQYETDEIINAVHTKIINRSPDKIMHRELIEKLSFKKSDRSNNTKKYNSIKMKNYNDKGKKEIDTENLFIKSNKYKCKKYEYNERPYATNNLNWKSYKGCNQRYPYSNFKSNNNYKHSHCNYNNYGGPNQNFEISKCNRDARKWRK